LILLSFKFFEVLCMYLSIFYLTCAQVNITHVDLSYIKINCDRMEKKNINKMKLNFVLDQSEDQSHVDT